MAVGKETYEVNHEMTLTALPVIIFIGIISVLGVIGNVVVIYVYYRKYPTCNFRHFVLILAVIDLTSCAVLMPFEMVTLVKWFIFPNAALCKCKSFLNVYTVTSSAATLLLIAIDRYRKVCRPHSKQIQPPCARKLTVFILVLAAIPASSDAVFWGIHHDVINRGDVNVTVTMCEKDDKYKDTLWPILHTLVLYATTNCIVMISTMVLYIFIAAKLFCVPSGPEQIIPRISVSTPLSMESDSGMASQRESIFKFPARDIESGLSESEDMMNSVDLSDVPVEITDEKNEETADDGANRQVNEELLKVGGDNTKAEMDGETLRLQEFVPLRKKHESGDCATKKTVRISAEIIRDSCSGNELHIPDIEHRRRPSTGRHTSPKSVSMSGQSRLLHRRRSTIASLPGHTGTRLRRKTLIMFILTSAFVGTTLLYFSLIGYLSKEGNFVSTLSHSERTAWMFFLRLYFINSILNPILYGFLDPRFRKALWNMGIHITWAAGSLKKNIAVSIRRSSSGRNKNEVTVTHG